MVNCFIFARGGSKGFPNKNIKLLNGIHLITYTINQAIQSKLFSKIVVSTDSQKIANAALAAGAECWFLRPKYLSSDKASKLDAIRHAVIKAESKFNRLSPFLFVPCPCEVMSSVFLLIFNYSMYYIKYVKMFIVCTTWIFFMHTHLFDYMWNLLRGVCMLVWVCMYCTR